MGGKLYGAAFSGGAHGLGTLFSITTRGQVQVLHEFDKVTDGRGPYGGLTYKDGSLFGTTYYGGRYHDGTVFALQLTH